MTLTENTLSRAVGEALRGSDADLPIQTIVLPDTGLLRLKHIIGDPKANPPIPPMIPVKKSAWRVRDANPDDYQTVRSVPIAPRMTTVRHP